MKVLKVIHGYPPLYNAGSEVYSQTLCQELVDKGHEVVVFSRMENAYKCEYSTEWSTDLSCPAIRLCLINMTHSRDGYRHEAVDAAFKEVLDNFQPDVVHIGHLNHLSTSLVSEIPTHVPIIFTLHDFWLMCPRGQFLQTINSKTEDLYPVCESQENEKCARNCYWRYFSSQEDKDDVRYWTHWVDKRMQHVKEVSHRVDLFIAPSKYLMERFVCDFDIDLSSITYLDYGFHLQKLKGRQRLHEDDFVFGYIGTHKQAKGIFQLLQAFNASCTKAQLKIWGSSLEPFTGSLKEFQKTLLQEKREKIYWMGGYRNERIVQDVFNHIDAIVVPSIWGENSPLVIHEALEAGVPVITADYGGMREYVVHDVNGLLFAHRDFKSLAEQMRRLIEEPGLSERITKRGYMQSKDGHIPSIEMHTRQIVKWYEKFIEKRKEYDRFKARSLADHI
jgi:glycosyltransferase involved in cell wall biosynthesis